MNHLFHSRNVPKLIHILLDLEMNWWQLEEFKPKTMDMLCIVKYICWWISITSQYWVRTLGHGGAVGSSHPILRIGCNCQAKHRADLNCALYVSDTFVVLCAAYINISQCWEEHLSFYETATEQYNLANLPSISTRHNQSDKNTWILHHPRIGLGVGCLTSVIWPFIIIALCIASCLCCAIIEPFKLGILLSPLWKSSLLTHLCNG